LALAPGGKGESAALRQIAARRAICKIFMLVMVKFYRDPATAIGAARDIHE
jgi:hypothetical protein